MWVAAKDKAVGERYEEGRGDHMPRDAAGRSAVSKCETTHLMSAAWRWWHYSGSHVNSYVAMIVNESAQKQCTNLELFTPWSLAPPSKLRCTLSSSDCCTT
jgi:hypothetical protein